MRFTVTDAIAVPKSMALVFDYARNNIMEKKNQGAQFGL